MQKFYQFFRLIRFLNLLVIVLTMCVFYALLSNYNFERHYLLSNTEIATESIKLFSKEYVGFGDFNFILLVISVVLIAASGNIINDYFDQKADRINKPNRIIIDKYIKRRWAIILNWTFNSIGFFIAFYLSYIFSNWWILTASFISINLLYFYSAIYKRKFLTGNIIVAFLTGLVPIYVFIYAAFSNFGNSSPFGSNGSIFIADNLIAIIAYSGFAFFLNFIREIIKDMADVKGDLLLQSKTLPIRFGFKKTKYFLSVLYSIVLLPLIYFIFIQFTSVDFGSFGVYFLYLLSFVVVFTFLSFFVLITQSRPKYYNRSSNLLKIAMLFGVISALFYS